MKGLQLSVSYNACHQLGVGGKSPIGKKILILKMSTCQYIYIYILIYLILHLLRQKWESESQ